MLKKPIEHLLSENVQKICDILWQFLTKVEKVRTLIYPEVTLTKKSLSIIVDYDPS